jgi:hypothetical protein
MLRVPSFHMPLRGCVREALRLASARGARAPRALRKHLRGLLAAGCPASYADQLRDQRDQRRLYWPPFVPWVQGGGARGGPGGPTWPLGRWGRGPASRPPRPAPGLAPLPLLRTGGCRPGAEAARVLGSWACVAAPSKYRIR